MQDLGMRILKVRHRVNTGLGKIAETRWLGDGDYETPFSWNFLYASPNVEMTSMRNILLRF